jgi:hypothetical protein
MNKRKSFHIAIDYQYRALATNLASLNEERKLSADFGIQSCQYERWINETLAMSYSAKENDLDAKIMATKHLIKMIIRKHTKRENIKILNLSVDAENNDDFYQNYVLPELDFI